MRTLVFLAFLLFGQIVQQIANTPPVPSAISFSYVSGSVTGQWYADAGTTTTTSGIALHQTPGAGHLLVATTWWGSGTATATMADTPNGSWLAMGSVGRGTGDNTGFSYQMFCVSSSVATLPTPILTISTGVNYQGWEIVEYSYGGKLPNCAQADGPSILNVSGTAVSGVGTIGSITTYGPSALLVGGCMLIDSSCTAGSGFTGRNDANASGNFGSGYVTGENYNTNLGQLIEDKVNVLQGSQSATFGMGTTDNFGGSLAAF